MTLRLEHLSSIPAGDDRDAAHSDSHSTTTYDLCTEKSGDSHQELGASHQDLGASPAPQQMCLANATSLVDLLRISVGPLPSSDDHLQRRPPREGVRTKRLSHARGNSSRAKPRMSEMSRLRARSDTDLEPQLRWMVYLAVLCYSLLCIYVYMRFLVIDVGDAADAELTGGRFIEAIDAELTGRFTEEHAEL